MDVAAVSSVPSLKTASAAQVVVKGEFRLPARPTDDLSCVVRNTKRALLGVDIFRNQSQFSPFLTEADQRKELYTFDISKLAHGSFRLECLKETS